MWCGTLTASESFIAHCRRKASRHDTALSKVEGFKEPSLVWIVRYFVRINCASGSKCRVRLLPWYLHLLTESSADQTFPDRFSIAADIISSSLDREPVRRGKSIKIAYQWPNQLPNDIDTLIV